MRCTHIARLLQLTGLALSLWTSSCAAEDNNIITNTIINIKHKPLDIKTFHSLRRVSPPTISPNKRGALFITSYYTPDSNKSASYLSYLDIDSGSITRLTDDRPGTTLSNPIWFDDTSFGFLRRGALYRQNLSPDAVPDLLYDPPMPITKVAYSANKGLITFVASVYPNSTLKESAMLKRTEDNRTDSAMVFDNLWARHWNEWMSVEKPNVFSLPLKHQSETEWNLDTEINLTTVLPRCPDPLTRWSIDDYTLSPTGDNVAFVTRPPFDNMTWSTNVDIYLVSTSGNSKPRLLTAHIDGMSSSPVFSSDGRRLAWLQMETPGCESDINRIYVHNIAARETIAISYDWDLSPSSLVWSKDDKTIYTVTSTQGRNIIFSVDVATGKRKELTLVGSAWGLRPIDEQNMLFVHSTQDQPADIHLLNTYSRRTKQLTYVNKEALKDLKLCVPEDFLFNGAHGDKVHGWLLRPYDFDQRKKYPLALLIHGGPQQASIQSFSHSQWNPNMYSNAGFVTVVINFHGSPGYSKNFTDSIRHKWGDLPYVDLMRGIDFVTSKYKFVDSTRMAALGGSYGGYMVNWLNGHTDKFKCMVAHDGKFSTVSGYYGTDELWFPEWDLGKPWEIAGRTILEENNPERFASNFKTPTLFIQGEKDFRIPVSESLGAWTMLRRRSIPARFVYFPDEDHWINKMGNSMRWYTEVLDWITTWTNTTAPYHIR
ncbi:dipeptidylpeptidase [Kickxella alabastrina]|uniref:Dipeptidylpeptidase n=1 Tax=Kickxella alabastrina TaxID=61397 RepID=A0ACC1IHV4_9FUNG|nr:dipeptidylpeptidase [Kickxella alabastrina]